MQSDIDELKKEVQAKFAYWHNLKSKKLKALLIILFIGLVSLKIFTTVLTFDWLTGLV
ncbi:hypothetical protein HII17_13445 [Thalassotalea sp. M1531]|uniref:Preprotein translocase subunit SecE n=1 Tax=Thalassotalea algicola TaxID=2716224 RepID=A0A7Y0LDJ1_9GAMM|nr:hypothetical protein [Thalassotalea algicola]NMP32565.1 hypothetical protein [Thalassotalea algicola]